jgi:hypothetical protein
MLVRFHCLALVLFVASCATTSENTLTRIDNKFLVLDPSNGLDGNWENQVLRKRKTTYTRFDSRLGNTIKATGNISASILYRVFEGIDLSCNTLEWNWFIEELQETSDLRKKGLDDVGASILVAFGDPGPFRDNPVPTLKYVWANAKHTKNDIITGPYQAKYLRTIIVQSGPAAEYGLVRERRNLVSDYEEAFSVSPTDKIYAIGLFTDNDDTREPITAHYGAITLICDPSKI